LLVLDAEFRIIRATPSFYRTFQVSEGDTDGRILFDLGNGQWNIPVLRDLLLHLLPRDASFESYQVDHDFPSIGHKSMILNARQIHPRAGGGPLILLAIEDVTLREHANRSRLEAARDEERRLIAAELHDDLVQQLAGMAMEIGRHAAKPPERPALLKKELRSLQTRVVQAAEVARNVAYKLHPTELDDLGLEAALRLYCENFGQQEGIDVAFTCQSMPPALSRETSYCLYKVAQESLRNIAKHARAKRATVSIEGAADGIRLCVEDSGIGFSVSSLRGATGLGIVSMKERVQLANGEFSITSEPGKGTRISVNASLREIRR
jgi:signal transduction histidine kinase